MRRVKLVTEEASWKEHRFDGRITYRLSGSADTVVYFAYDDDDWCGVIYTHANGVGQRRVYNVPQLWRLPGTMSVLEVMIACENSLVSYGLIDPLELLACVE